jgi:outer membrane protein assembly factor BamB
LFQEGAANRAATRQQFLLKAYREVVARFGNTGRIEHPLPFLRQLAQDLDGLSKRVDCRVDDFDGLGLYVLIRDANSFYLLATRGGNVQLDTGGGFEALTSPDLSERGCVKQLQLDTAGVQQELFSQTMRDHLGLYRIDPASGDAPGARLAGAEAALPVMRVVMGGNREEVASVLEILRDGEFGTGVDTTVDHPQASQKVVYVFFAPATLVRDPVLDALRAGGPRSGLRARRVVTAASAMLVFAVLASVWITGRTDRSSELEVTVPDASGPEEPVAVTQESSPRLTESVVESQAREGETIEPPEVSEPPAGEAELVVRMELAWQKSYSEPVTTTPVVDGANVIFGARDGHVYSLDTANGEDDWVYTASAGVGASPVVVGGSVVGADYNGNVFCLSKETGETLWTRALGSRVVSTPCVEGGEVLVGCMDGVGYGLSLETGRVLWRVATRVRIRASAAAAGGHFYLPSYSGWLYAIAQGSGAVTWRNEVGGQLASTPAADEDRVVIGGEEGVYALAAETGEHQWRFRTGQPVNSFIVLEGERVYAGSNDRHVYCLDATTGELVWKTRMGEAVLSRPRLVDGMLFVTSYDRYIYCLDAETGEVIDRFATSGSIYSSPTVAGDHVFFGNNQGEFYCISYRGSRSEQSERSTASP